MTETAQRKPAYRRWWFWLLVLGLVYLVTGFGLIPLYLSSALPDRFQQHLGWSTEIGDVSFNPFTLTVGVDELLATDDTGRTVLDVEAVHLDLGLMELLRGTLHIESLELQEPDLRVDLLAGNRINLLEDWRRHQQAGSAAGEAPSLVLDELVSENGRLRLLDLTEQAANDARPVVIESVGLTLSGVATRERDEPGEFSLQAEMGEQVLEASGTLGLQPLWSNGRLSVSDLSAATVRQWLGQYLPWSLQDGEFSLSSAYQFAYDDQGLALATRNGELTASGLALADPAQPDATLANADALSLTGVAFNLDGPELVVSMVEVQGLYLNAVLGPDGQLNLTRALSGNGSDDDGSRGFRWSVGNLSLSRSRIDWQDQRLASPVQVGLEDLELNLGAMTEQLEEPVSYQVRTSLARGGAASGSGQFTLRPLTFEGGINLDQVVLAPFNGYLGRFSQLEVLDGTLNLAGNIDIDVQDDPLTGTFSGRGAISHFNGQFPDEAQPVASWRELRLDPIEYNFAPARLEIGTLTLSEPELNVINYRDRPHNVTRLLTPADTGHRPEGENDNGPQDALIFRLAQMDVANAEIRYTDYAPQPAFTGRVHDLQASVAGLSNITPQQGQFTLGARVNGSGDLRAEGIIATLGTDEPSRIDVVLEGLSMPVVSPYFAFYMGYRVDSGKLSADGSYTLEGTRIDSTTTLTLDRLELGEAVQSDRTVTAPVKLGLTLLRDGDGQVTLEIPVDGDLSRPDFDFGPVMAKTLRSALVKAAMSPFSLLGSVVDLAGFSPDELGTVAFLPGETTLEMGEYTKMEKVAEALKARDELVLAIRGRAVESIDRPVLEAGLGEDEALTPGVLDALAEQRGQTLRRLLVDEYNVPAAQIYLRAHRVEAGEGADAGPVAMQFELETR